MRRQPFRNKRAHMLARAAISSASGARTLAQHHGSLRLHDHHAAQHVGRDTGSSSASRPWWHCRLSQPSMASRVRRKAPS